MNNKQLQIKLAAAGHHLQVWEQHIHSFVDICVQSNNVDAGYDDHGGLAGITVGVKDIIDVKGMPTRNGSAVCRHAEPAVADAAVVAALRNAGAHIVGKTTTTEFAFTDPTNCRNPYDLRRSPGGSSSGSGAAVAAGLVDMALGTQTAGSLCRPAAYCGVVGFKPSYGILPTTGVTPLATSFDTVGVITSSIDVARKGFMAMGGMAPSHIADEFLVASALLPTETSANVETLNGFRDASDVLQREGISVKEFEICLNISDIVSAHRTVMNAEAADAHQHLLKPDYFTLLQAKFRAGLQAGIAVSASQLEDAQGVLALARTGFWRQLAGVDIVLTLPVPEGAPLMDGTTGFQDWLTPWTVFGGPLVCLPWGLDSLGRPVSVMLAAHPGEDSKLLAMAKRLEPLAAPMPRPQLPVS